LPSLFCLRNLIKGIVVETGNTPILEYGEDLHIKGWLKKSLRSTHANSLTSVALGDVVTFTIQDDLGLINSIETPRTLLCRESVKNINRSKILAANLDQVFIVLSAGNPETPIGLIDRMIVASKSGGMKVILCFNKMDEKTPSGEDVMNLYQKLSYPLIKISAKKKENLVELKEMVKGKKSILLGSSGVGKSTIIKSLTGLTILTSELNAFSGKGRHTTVTSHLYKIEPDTYIADIPGIKQLGFVAVEKADIFFPEIMESASKCQFSNCTHTKEESCQVKRDLANDKIDRRRYESYQKLIEEIKQFK
jgi:ribosome biogenesis GTPase